MEGAIGATKRVLVVMMLLLAAVVVQAQEVSPPPSSPGSPKHDKRFVCPLKCGIKCLPSVKFGPVKYGLCLGLCLIKCIHSPPNEDVVYDCTEKCAVFKTTIFKPDSYYEVGSYVESCYEGCSNKSSTVGHGF